MKTKLTLMLVSPERNIEATSARQLPPRKIIVLEVLQTVLQIHQLMTSPSEYVYFNVSFFPYFISDCLYHVVSIYEQLQARVLAQHRALLLSTKSWSIHSLQSLYSKVRCALRMFKADLKEDDFMQSFDV